MGGNEFINESTYWYGTGRIPNYWNRLVHEVQECAPAIILPILFGKVNIFPLLEQLPKNIQNENMQK